jgi:hypothetical protein
MAGAGVVERAPRIRWDPALDCTVVDGPVCMNSPNVPTIDRLKSMARRSRPFRQSTTFRVLVVLFVVGFVLLLALPGAGFVTLPTATPFAGGASLLP